MWLKSTLQALALAPQITNIICAHQDTKGKALDFTECGNRVTKITSERWQKQDQGQHSELSPETLHEKWG